MAFQTVFKRYELKYLLTLRQKEAVLKAMGAHMEPDKYGKTTIRNLYFDTPNYLLARRSLDKPVYKEKLRLRSYGRSGPDSTVFVELKKKYKHVVYKRRISMPEREAMDWLAGRTADPRHTQISGEVAYALAYYGDLRPVVYLSYEREAYFAKEDSGFRITFDENILCRQSELSLGAQVYGLPVLPEDRVLMEIKCAGGIPLWLTRVLTQERIYKTSFSKYGTAYEKYLLPQQITVARDQKEAKHHA